MKTLKLLSALLIGSLLFTSCYVEVNDDPYIDEYVDDSAITLDELLNSYEIWYVDIERTQGNGEIPFFQKAFTVSFKNGTFFANNNLVGIGSNGNGFGLDVGFYDTFSMELDITHDLDGFYDLRVIQLSSNEIKIQDRVTNTSYYLIGHQRNSFDYDKVFYDNIHYFLQEYDTWEKVYTSDFGVLNEFDNENFIQFLPFGQGDNFRSSQDLTGTPIVDLLYDYTGHYGVNDVANDFYLKTLTLDYDYLGNEFFELTVINDNKIELLHAASGTIYHFSGRGYIQFKNAGDGKQLQNDKKRVSKADFMKLKK